MRALIFTALLWAGVAGAQPIPAPGLSSNNPTFTGTLRGTYSSSGAPGQFSGVNAQGTMNWPIAAAGGCCRLRYWSDTVNVTGNQAGVNVLETNFFNLLINGTGTLTNEAFNIVHPYSYIGPGITINGYAENFESSTLNDGTISGAMLGNLNIFSNGAAATVGTFSAFKTSATNANTTAGAFSNYTGFECAGFSGAGSVPTYNWCLVNRDSTASIVSLGGVVIGTLANAGGPGTLFIQGANTSAGTYPFTIKNSATANLLSLNNAGGMTLYLGDLTVSTGSVSAPAYKVNGTLGANCTAGTVSASTLVVQYGIVTHC